MAHVLREPVLVFDIETVPDVDGERRLRDCQDLDDAAVMRAMAERRHEERGTDFQPLHLHRVVAIGVALREKEGFRVWSLGEPHAPEVELVQRFFDGVEKYRPVLVSWNGSGFDLPVLHYRALIHGVVAPRYWDTGHFDRDAKWDHYLSRYQFRHTDLMDVLALYQPRAFVPLHELAVLCGLPGKLGLEGAQVAAAWSEGRIAEIRAYCETDVLNTYLLYLRFQKLRGLLAAEEYRAELERVRGFLAASRAPHWAEFLRLWTP
jgi:predicted PolB exonuclease-like 3'-5' exonuclease